ncbi:hypothetical protein E1B28_008907 [Marasmius oreades]|uniref:START domain-containing protein n=1 Tax=Marasmius oreades TaxID=181124 RepID=A0A9P7RZW4_9AGAR|nr:uncharacterized protein E1B28_008907 [Marasmius oreades]KAG7092558.1 hypothetical protein E1B28_008907 [Marasmius oreades]
MSDGSRLRESWYIALNDAESRFRQLLTSPSNEWKRVVHSSANATSSGKGKGKARAPSSLPEVTDVVVHRNSTQSREDTYRLVLEVPAGEDLVSLEPWRAVLSTPELRQEWDPAVIDAHLMETFDYETRIIKTNFTLGWPANPRDTVTIARTIHDHSTVIDIATSLPRSPDEPAYLRPSPPYVRSHVSLFSWCIQHIKLPRAPTDIEQQPKRRKSLGGKLRITCYWQHDLRAIWNVGSPGNMACQLSSMVLGLLKTTLKRATRIPKLVGYGYGVNIERIRFQNDREALTVDYAVIPEDEEHQEARLDSWKTSGLEALHVIRERRRLTRALEYSLPASEGWDVQLLTRASSEEVENLPWTALAFRSSSSSLLSSSVTPLPLDQILLRLTHAPLIDDHSILKVTIVIEISGPSSGLRLNGVPQTIQDSENGRFPANGIGTQQIFQDLASAMGISTAESSSIGSASIGSSSASLTSSVPVLSKERSAAAEKTILARIKRSYIYFSSLLQEPEAKWKRTTEARGVTVTQLDSIDPTLVVYNAEATFVGVNIWDLYAAVVSHGVKEYWDKQHEDAILLDDVNELTELWHLKTRAAWPVNGRDSVVLKTVYKSPTTIHVFSFSADDLAHLFPPGLIPPPASSTAANTGTISSSSSVNASVIRTQVDLRGWAIEALSPTTTRLTLLEQSDPKGWANKTSIPTTMISALAGIGDFAIKWGGVPIVTRLAGAKKTEVKYEHERRSWRVEYEPLAPSKANEEAGGTILTTPVIECEIRCDMDLWSPTSLDIIVDPPPQAISCLRRHRLSPEGGGVWLTITHQDAVFIEDERLMIIVRRGPSIGSGGSNSAGGFVMVNGERIEVDYEEMDEDEIRNARVQKRVKPTRVPLDQPPVAGVIRKRREMEGDNNDSAMFNTTANASATPKISSPLARLFTYAVDQTQQTIAAIAPTEGQNLQDDDSSQEIPTANKTPMQHALDALTWTQDFHANPLLAGWVNVNERPGIIVKRRVINEVSGVVPVFKGEKVIEGVHAEDLAAVIGELTLDGGNGGISRKKWDDRYEEERVLQRYEGGGRASFVIGKSGFPFRDRGFYVATLVAREQDTIPGMSRRNTAIPATDTSNGVDPGTKTPSTATNSPAIYIVSTSFNPSTLSMPFDSSIYNPYTLPVGRIHLDAWILETLDPYNTKENYAVPSARCTRLTCVDYNGAVVNSMVFNYNGGYMVRALMGLDVNMRERRAPVMRTPAQGLVLKGRRDDDEEDVADGDMFRKMQKRTWRIGAEGGKVGWRSIDTIWRGESWREKRTMVDSKFDVGKNSFEALVLVNYSCERKTKLNQSEEATQDPFTSKVDKSNSNYPSFSSAVVSNAEKNPSTSPSPPPASTRTLSPLPDRNRRERTLSNISSTSSTTATPETPPVVLRGRSDLRFHRGNKGYDDFLVGEWVIDLHLYPEGYEVAVRTRVLQENNNKSKGLIELESVFEDPEVEKVVFPFIYRICRLSVSLYQGGIGFLGPSTSPVPQADDAADERAAKHLLKISLPTGEYLKAYGQLHQETIKDPLTGEIREPREVEFPKWVHALGVGTLKGEDPSNVIVGVEIRPSTSGKSGIKRRRKVVVFDDSCRAEGKEINVVDEKESFPREQAYSLVDRVRNEPGLIPSGLEKPIAIRKQLVDHAALEAEVLKQDESSSGSTVARDIVDEGKKSLGALEGEAGETAEKILSTSSADDASAGVQIPSLNHLNHDKGGFLGIGHRLGSLLQMSRETGGTGTGEDSSKAQGDTNKDRIGDSTSPRLDSINVVETTQRNVKHGWWMFMIVAVIAFLLGSFMRSLLEPTDFVYVASTEGHIASAGEWREVKRIMELPSGRSWDLWIGFVRRR